MSRLGALYVEDDETNRSLMATIFKRYLPNISVTIVSNGAEALDTVAAAQPQLLLLDGHLGDMTAAELQGRLRERLGDSLPPIVVVSGSMPHDEAMAMDGVVQHVVKPYNITDFVALISRLLNEDPVQ